MNGNKQVPVISAGTCLFTPSKFTRFGAGFSDATKLPPEAESNIPSGKMYHIACKIWFTPTGSLRPLSFKFAGDDGELLYVSDMAILYSEDKNYSGIASKEYGCEAIIGGLFREFKLIFYCEACKWVMLI